MESSAVSNLKRNEERFELKIDGEKRISSFFKSMLEKDELLELAEKILRDETLTQTEVLKLALARLPILGKLVELIDPLPKTLYLRSNELEKNENTFFHALPDSLEQFVPELLELRETKKAKNPDFIWCASLEEALDSFSLDSKKPLGLSVLNYIALARLVLGNTCLICAPLNLLGQNLSFLAICYGSNDLGFIESEKQNELLAELHSHAHLELTISCL